MSNSEKDIRKPGLDDKYNCKDDNVDYALLYLD